MKRFWKRFAVPFIAVTCALMLAGAWAGVQLSANAGTYRLDSLEGDTAYLNGVRIEMQLADTAHTQHITLNGSKISHSYAYSSPFKTADYPLFNSSQTFVEDPGADVQVKTTRWREDSGDYYEEWITRKSRSADTVRESVAINKNGTGYDYFDLPWVQVVTDITVHDAGHPFVFNFDQDTTIYKGQTSADGSPLPDTASEMPYSSSGSELTNGDYDTETGNTPLVVTAPDGTVYFTPELRPYHSGSSAIYRLDEWGRNDNTEEPVMIDGNLTYSDTNAKNVGKVTKLAAFPVDGHQLRTVSLNMAGDRLCLLLVVDGMMTLRVYGLDGTLQNETALFRAGPYNAFDCTLYTNKSGGDTMLCYYLQDPAYGFYQDPPQESESTLFCVRLGEKAEFKSSLTGRNSVMRAAYIGSRWVLAESENAEGLFSSENPPSDRYFVSILNAAGATMYRGEVITDAPEDEIQSYISTGDESNDELTVSRWLQIDDITED